MTEYMVPSDTPGISLYVRNKHPEGMQQFSPDKILLYVHGSTYPSETAFDLSLGGISWMEYIAERGYDVWLVDLRGYGKSTRPAELDLPAEQNPPLVRTEVAVSDVSSAVNFIL
jgi:pimeloyl-ACP methyl ester carboxylesterase